MKQALHTSKLLRFSYDEWERCQRRWKTYPVAAISQMGHIGNMSMELQYYNNLNS
jgi:hypothetical protein